MSDPNEVFFVVLNNVSMDCNFPKKKKKSRNVE